MNRDTVFPTRLHVRAVKTQFRLYSENGGAAWSYSSLGSCRKCCISIHLYEVFSASMFITKTRRLTPLNPLKPHLYIVELGSTGVYLFIFAKNINCGYSLESPRRAPTTYVLRKNMKNARVFIWKYSDFGGDFFIYVFQEACLCNVFGYKTINDTADRIFCHYW